MNRVASKWLVIPVPKLSPKLQLICFHHAAGGASTYRSWTRLLRHDTELVLVQLPGRENRLTEPALTSVEAVFDGLIPALRSALVGPYAIFGHSLGSTLCHLLACRVSRTGELPPPGHIFLSGERPPSLEANSSESSETSAALQNDDRLIETLASLGGTQVSLFRNREFVEMLLPAARGDSRLGADSASKDRCVLDVPLTILQGAKDPTSRPTTSEQWQHLSSSPVQVFTYPGDHFFIQSARETVLQTINDVLGRVIPASVRL